MRSYINPEIILITDPTGIDYPIQRMQTYLGNLLWLEKIYGRVNIQRSQEKRENGKGTREVIYPEAWGKNKEPENVMPNDNLNAYAFFIAHDPAEYQNFDALDTQIFVKQKLSVVFWMQLDKLDNTKQYRYTESLKKQILNVLRQVSGFKMTNHYEEYDKVLKEFTITDSFKEYLKPKFYGLRITGDLYYHIFTHNDCDSQQDIFPLPDYTEAKISALFDAYAPKVLSFEVGTDIEAGTTVEILREYGFGDVDAPLALSEVDILSVIWQNTPLQDISKINNDTQLDFSSIGGIFSGKITILFRKKIS